jgi:rod shape-determining protein MreC
MFSSRDDFIIAIRSAFLKKSTQQKFSLLTLFLVSTFIIFLSSLDFKVIRYLKIGINEVVYRSSFLASIPENLIKNTFLDITEYVNFYNKYKKDKEELRVLRSKNISNEITKFENKELKELINDYVSSSDKVLAKIIVDHKSPFLRSIIINKGSKESIKIGTNVYDQSYLIGRVIEVNYKTSRVLLLSDLNSNIPVTIVPQNVQAIITGSGDKYGHVKYLKKGITDDLKEQSIVYTSGTGDIFKSGVPIGKLISIKEKSSERFEVEFFSDFSQLKYVFAEVSTISITDSTKLEISENNAPIKNPLEAKLKILEDEKKIIEKTNLKFKEENELLINKVNNLNNEMLTLNAKISSQDVTINQSNIDKDELEFLRLNLEYSKKCLKNFFNQKGFLVGTPEYKNCILNKGRKNNG